MYKMTCGSRNNIEIKVEETAEYGPHVSISLKQIIKNQEDSEILYLDLSWKEAMDLGINISKIASRAKDRVAELSPTERRNNIFTRN